MADDSIISVVQKVAQQLYDQNGKVETRALVDAARPKTSPAHAAFEWDNKKAGEEYRLIQGRNYIRRVTIIRNDQPERLIHVPKIHFEPMADADPDQPESRDGHYQVASVLVSHPDEFERALHATTLRFDAARKALDDLYTAAEQTGRADQAAMIAQMSKATMMFADALKAMH